VGRKVVEMLDDAGEETVVIDREGGEGVDFVADALDSEALESAGVKEAQAVILALSSDSTNLFAGAIVRDLAPDVPIIARVGAAADVGRIRAAGADFALSISQVAGQLLGRQLLGEEFISLEPSIRLVKVAASGLEGLTPASARIRERSGCSIVALEREGSLLVDLEPELKIFGSDCVYLCGSAEAVSSYFDLFPGARGAEMR
jgi:Trk K+ transport system NAD-binding subunit